MESIENKHIRYFIKNGILYGAYQKDASGIGNMKPFLYQISRNMVIDHYRQKDRSKTVSTDHITEVIDRSTDIHKKAVINQEMETIRGALQNIKKDYQDVVIWHYLEDMSIPEIAELMNKPAGTVRVMLHRGLKDLKDIIQES